MADTNNKPTSPGGSISEAFVDFGKRLYLVFAIWCALISIWLSGDGCDDHCSGTGWTGDRDAWEWSAIGWLGVIGLVACAVGLRTSRRRHLNPRLAWAAYAIALSCHGAWFLLFHAGGGL
jgi:hypothetical protein